MQTTFRDRMNINKFAATLMLAFALTLPATVAANTINNTQSQMIVLLQQVVSLQTTLINSLNAQVSQLQQQIAQLENNFIANGYNNTIVSGSQSCVFNGQVVPSGASVTAYQSPTVPSGQTCASQLRTCLNGALSGTYTFATCSLPQPIAVNTVLTSTGLNLSMAEPPFANGCVGPGELGASNISDPTDPLVSVSQQAILGLGMSAPYFNTHFTLLCGANGVGDHRVLWKYSIGSYSIPVLDTLGYTMQTGSTQYTSGLPNLLHALSDIQTVITQDAAASVMQQCIGNFTNANVSLIYSQGQHAVPALTANPQDNTMTCMGGPSGPCRHNTGTVDLTTGLCTKNY